MNKKFVKGQSLPKRPCQWGVGDSKHSIKGIDPHSSDTISKLQNKIALLEGELERMHVITIIKSFRM